VVILAKHYSCDCAKTVNLLLRAPGNQGGALHLLLYAATASATTAATALRFESARTTLLNTSTVYRLLDEASRL
jgi:hypothetical protein